MRFLFLALLLLAGCEQSRQSQPDTPTTREPAFEMPELPPRPDLRDGAGGWLQIPMDGWFHMSWRGGLYNVWVPSREPIGGIILHSGHGPFRGYLPEQDLTPVALSFADAGFYVYGIEMPNDDLVDGPHSPRGPIDRFFKASDMVLDMVEPTGLPMFMAGVSGGGWTTVLMTYRDERILRGYTVAGSHPNDSHTGDWEQAQFTQEQYWEMYRASSDRITYIFNYYDPCCWPMIEGDQGFPYVSDTTHDTHNISPWAVDYIIDDILSTLLGREINRLDTRR